MTMVTYLQTAMCEQKQGRRLNVAKHQKAVKSEEGTAVEMNVERFAVPLVEEPDVNHSEDDDVHAALSQINVRKAAGPDGTPGRVLRGCAEQLTGVFTDIFNLSLAQAAVPACFKATSIVPVPKHSSPTGLNDYRPVALTPIIMKCFERLVLAHLKNCLPPTLDSYQFAYRSNRSTEDAVSTVLHSVLTHLDNNNTYARMLFVDFSSAFNTVIPSKLNTKLGDLGFNNPLRHWLMDFLTNRPQYVKSGHTCSTTITLNTGVPQGCVLSPFLYSLFTHDCRPVHGSNTIIKFADDTTVIGLISNNDETAYREEVQHLAAWCADNNLLLNTSKTKELIVDFRRKRGSTHNPIHINGMAVERVSSFKFLGTHITEDLSWSTNTSSLIYGTRKQLGVYSSGGLQKLDSLCTDWPIKNTKTPTQSPLEKHGHSSTPTSSLSPGNSKQLFSTINHLLKPQTLSHTDTTEKQCNNFIIFFRKKVDTIRSLLSSSPALSVPTDDPLPEIVQPFCCFPKISQREVEDIIRRMKPSTCTLDLFPTALESPATLGKKVMISVDHNVVNDQIPTFISAICLRFGSHYSLNIHHPMELASTLEFLQSAVAISPGEQPGSHDGFIDKVEDMGRWDVGDMKWAEAVLRTERLSISSWGVSISFGYEAKEKVNRQAWMPTTQQVKYFHTSSEPGQIETHRVRGDEHFRLSCSSGPELRLNTADNTLPRGNQLDSYYHDSQYV
ncbi:hypothetical protein F2P81_020810 [Scophthalmus maximus]|uniref:Reverse transcriptase domain-containing protein n=1 Tax=Scophthalmus maximus TaxID=52904 RepID=A0A6A4RVL5_SCOMX|nr:hypothetical protein F2P81_020810 [Scophthalmus maximus]